MLTEEQTQSLISDAIARRAACEAGSARKDAQESIARIRAQWQECLRLEKVAEFWKLMAEHDRTRARIASLWGLPT